jgi:hypothetical protein
MENDKVQIYSEGGIGTHQRSGGSQKLTEGNTAGYLSPQIAWQRHINDCHALTMR